MDPKPVTLEGRHVRLEPLSLAHHQGLAAVLEPTLLQWFSKPATNAEELRLFIEEALAAQDAGAAVPFCTVDRASGRAVGSTRFATIDRANRRLEIGWTWIGRTWQRTAVNTEAKLLMLTHAFEALGAIRVELRTDSLNAQSRAAMTRLGLVEEGILRNHVITATGRHRHDVYFSAIAEEWPALKSRIEARLARGASQAA